MRKLIVIIFLVILICNFVNANQKIIIDTDPAQGDSDIDDMTAIVYAARSSGYDIMALTTGYGNAQRDSSYYFTKATEVRNALYNAGVEFIPIIKGHDQDQTWDGMGIDLEAVIAGTAELPPKAVTPASNYIKTVVNDSEPGEITIIMLGTLTSLATAMNKYPDGPVAFQQKVKKIWIVAGAVGFVGNVPPFMFGGEWNIFRDKAAADYVFRKAIEVSGEPKIEVIPLEATMDTIINKTEIAYIKSKPTNITNYIVPYLEWWTNPFAPDPDGSIWDDDFWTPFLRNFNSNLSGFWPYDTIGTAISLNSSLVTRRELHKLGVNLITGKTDIRDDLNDRQRVGIVYDFDVAAFHSQALDHFTRPDGDCKEDCNQYDSVFTTWEYYCDGLNVMKRKAFYDYYCQLGQSAPGICMKNISYFDKTLVKTCSDKCVNGACQDCLDKDNDGYKDISCGGQDCNDNNANIKPGAAETCFNQIDDNCNGQIDENCGSCTNGQTRQCGTNVGQCTFGIQTCVNKEWGACAGGVQPVPETCPVNGIDEDCDGEVDEINCDARSDYIADWQDDLSDTPSHYPYISYVSMGHLGMTYWHNGDINNDGTTEKYLLLGETFRTAFWCQAQDMQNRKVSDIVNYNWNSYGCTLLGNIMSEKNKSYCGDLMEWSYQDQTFSSPQKEIYNSDMFCTVAGAPSSWGWNKNKITYNGKNVVAVRCGLDRDCPSDKYCKKPNINDVTTYYCELKCGNGICDAGENCPADSSGQEICDGKDNDCDGQIDENLVRQCGATNLGECKYGTQTCSSGNWGNCVGNIEPTSEVCDGRDNDCDGSIDENLNAPNCPLQQGVCAGSKKICGGASGWMNCNEYSYGPDYQALEISCDGKDNDCDGLVDENRTMTIFLDKDEDGFGNKSNSIDACNLISGYSTYAFDCNDNDTNINPSMEEIYDGKDNNCDGEIDEGFISINISLFSGWNLISIPINLTNNSIKSIFDNFSYIFSYNNSNKKWLFYKNESYNDFKEIDEKMGLWVKSLENKTLFVEGYPLDYPITMPLYEGWNLIAYPSLNTSLINKTLENYSSIFAYYNNNWFSNSKDKPNNLDSLKNFTPGFGYWVYSDNQTNLTINS